MSTLYFAACLLILCGVWIAAGVALFLLLRWGRDG